MGGESSLRGPSDVGGLRRVGRRKFLIAAGGAAALILAPGGLDTIALAHEPPENVALGEGEILLDAVTYRGQLWALVQTPTGTILRTPTGNAPSFPDGFYAESLGKSGSRILAGGHRTSPLRQKFAEGNYADLIVSSGLTGLVSQPGLDRWPTEGVYEFQTDELVPAYATLSTSGWSAPLDVPNMDDVAGSVTSIVGGTSSLELVVDSLLDSSMRDSATQILNVVVSTQYRRSERTHIADTVHGTSTVLGQDNDKTYVLASSLDAKTVVEVGAGAMQAVELAPELTPLSVSVENGSAELFVGGGNGGMGSMPFEEVVRRDGDIGDHLQDENLGKRSFGEDVVLAYEIEGGSS